MSLYAIGDLHLSFDERTNKPMTQFGWGEHAKKIKNSWESMINPDDTVVIAGDVSWGKNFERSLADLDWICDLPGDKILLKGNHDRFWQLNKLKKRYGEKLKFLHNTAFSYKDYSIVGTKGFDEESTRLKERESFRLLLSIQSAKSEKLLVFFHYPPQKELLDILRSYAVEKVIYAHLHGKHWNERIKKDGFKLVSADYLQFKPKLIVK